MFDIFVSIFALILLSPILILTSIFIYKDLGYPIIFTQDRPGKEGKIFKIMKFRTMQNNKYKNSKMLSDEERITKFGAWLRSVSLDELPSLFNVLRGDMSIVGPRPLLVEYLHLYSDYQSRRHEVLPGMTGWAQINGRNSLSWQEKFNLDVWYVDHKSFWLDLKIIFMTFSKVFRRIGINDNKGIGQRKFKGNIK